MDLTIRVKDIDLNTFNGGIMSDAINEYRL